MEKYLELTPLKAYRIPIELLLHLLLAVLRTPTEVPLELATTKLLDLEFNLWLIGGGIKGT